MPATPPPLPSVAVVIVNYNTRDHLARCLHSVSAAAQNTTASVTTVVVDNASHDASAALVAAKFPEVLLLASAHNLGFTGGNNLALAALGFDVTPPLLAASLLPGTRPTPPSFVFLLNPDTEIAVDVFERCLEFMQAHADAAACGANLRYGDGSFQHGAFQFPGLAQVALDLFPLHDLPGAHRLYASALNGRYPQQLWQQPTPFPVDFVLGAAMFLRGAAVQAIGGLDDGYFMYCEEMDWCLRASAAGWRVFALPTAHVTHFEGQASRQVRWRAFERLWRSRFRFYTKHSVRYSAAFRLALRGLVRSAVCLRTAQTRRRFATGVISGVEAAQELTAYATLARL